jgi:hypothetical protein
MFKLLLTSILLLSTTQISAAVHKTLKDNVFIVPYDSSNKNMAKSSKEKKDRSWVTFKYALDYSDETIEVKFPATPMELALFSWRGFFVNEGDVEYSLQIEPREGRDADLSPAEFLTEFLNEETDYLDPMDDLDEEIIIGYNITEAKNYAILDMTVTIGCEEELLLKKRRMIVTDKSLYILGTKHKPNTPDKHEYFIRSFKF